MTDKDITFIIEPPFKNSDPDFASKLPTGKLVDVKTAETSKIMKEGITSPGFLDNAACPGLDFVNTNQVKKENFTSEMKKPIVNISILVIVIINILVLLYILFAK